MRTESEIQRAILDYLHAHGIIAHKQAGIGRVAGRQTSWSKGGTNGISDITGVLPGGRALKIEVKRPGGKASKEQAAYIVACQKAGAVAFIAESVEDVDRGLKHFGVRVKSLWTIRNF